MAQFWRCDRCKRECNKNELELVEHKINPLTEDEYNSGKTSDWKRKTAQLAREQQLCPNCSLNLVTLLTQFYAYKEEHP